MFALLDAVTGVAYQSVIAIEATVRPVFGGLSTAAAIVLLAAGVRLLLFPLTLAAARGERARARLGPRLLRLRERHRKDPARFQREMLALYRSEGVSPVAGLGPLLTQAPVLTVVYRLFLVPDVAGQSNMLLHRGLFGVPLGSRWWEVMAAAGPLSGPGLVFFGLFALLGVIAWVSPLVARRFGMAPAQPVPRLVRLLPFSSVAAAAFVPLAAGVYLLAGTAWALGERAAVGTWLARGDGGGKVPAAVEN